MKYEILFADSYEEIERSVNYYIKQGWEPQGGVSVVLYKIPATTISEEIPIFRFHQGMIKKEAPQD